MNIDKKNFSRNLRNNMTPQEKKLWYQFLKNQDQHWRRQAVKGKYILDFYCRELLLAIELDGDQHYQKDGLLHDSIRTEFLEQHNIKVIRFSNYDVDRNFEEVCSVIKSFL